MWERHRIEDTDSHPASRILPINAGAVGFVSGEQCMPSLLDVIFRRVQAEPEIPVCPSHEVEMRLRGKLGKPTRFADQSEEEYTLIYFCPVPECNHTAETKRVATQIPVPGESPARPAFSRRGR